MFFRHLDHKPIFRLAIPMILSNISIPLLGIVDTAVLGHLESERYLAAVALGCLVFSFLYWGFGFLRMGTTALTAKAYGENNSVESRDVLFRALFLSFFISAALLSFQSQISSLSLFIVDSGFIVEQLAHDYFLVRIWSSPATLCLYVLMGWFIGRQNANIPLLVVLIINISNIILDVIFVQFFHMTVKGVALATVIAEYLGLMVALMIMIGNKHIRTIISQPSGHIWRVDKFISMLKMNSHIFVRTWCLIFAFAFFTAQGARFGETVLAANSLLMNFQNFMAYALDGFAHAAEALVGKAVGEKNRIKSRLAVNIAGFWSALVALVFVGFYGIYGHTIIDLLTSINAVKQSAMQYLVFMIFMPLVSFLCYLFDGVFIGAMLTRAMMKSMVFSLFCVYLPMWYFSQHLGNLGLWCALTGFMLSRSLSMGYLFKRQSIV